MFSNDAIKFENDNGWNSFAKQIEVHNQSLSNKLGYNVSWDDALFSWYENLYAPLLKAIADVRLNRAFPSKTSGDVFLGALTHWNKLLEENENIPAVFAVYDFKSRNKERRSFISKLFNAQRPEREFPTAA